MPRREAPFGQTVGELQIDVVVEYIPTPVHTFLLVHRVIAFHTCHHRQALRRQRGVQLQHPHRQLIGGDRIGGILITTQDHQLRSRLIERMEIPCPTHHFMCIISGQTYILLRQIGQQLIPVVKAVGHMQRHVLLMPFLITIRRIGIHVRALTSVQHIHRTASLYRLTETTLPLHKSFHRVRHGHVDIQHPAFADGSFRYTRIRTDLDLRDILRFHLVQNQPYITVDRHIVDTQIIGCY